MSIFAQERKAAPVVHRALKTVEAMYRSAMAGSATIPAAELRAKAMEVFAAVRQERQMKIRYGVFR